MTLVLDSPRRESTVRALRPARIILVRHGKPAIPTNTRTSHLGFRRYIDAYQESGLDPQSAPPMEGGAFG